MKKVSSGGLIALMVLAAPAFAGKSVEPNCKKDKCIVTVMVNGNTCGGGIAISPDPVITAVGSGPVTITWKVIGDWQFDTKGVDIWDAGDTFKSAGKEGADTWTAFNKANAHATWRYDVNLSRKGKPAEKCSRDPTIVNH